ncbi:MAG: hypothetical protein E7348_04545 [Clostridiales bacterium]|nr:hypothetical protein [Clostridiales bacterium]
MRKTKVIFSLVLTLIVGLSTFAGCENLSGGNGEIEGRYRFVSRTDYSVGHNIEQLSIYIGSVINKYEIGDTIKENNIEHTYSADSYVLDVYEDNTFFLTSAFEYPETFNGSYPRLYAYEYTWYKENEEVFWTDQKEQYYFVRNDLDNPKTEDMREDLLYKAYREKDAIIFSIMPANFGRITEIRMEKVKMSEEEKLQRSVTGRYNFFTGQIEMDGETESLTVGEPNQNGVIAEYGLYVLVLKADGSALWCVGRQLLGKLETGIWRFENGNVVFVSECNDGFFPSKEVTFTVGKNTLTYEGEWVETNERATVIITLEK